MLNFYSSKIEEKFYSRLFFVVDLKIELRNHIDIKIISKEYGDVESSGLTRVVFRFESSKQSSQVDYFFESSQERGKSAESSQSQVKVKSSQTPGRKLESVELRV